MNREAERKRLVELVRQGIDIPCVTDNPWDDEACKDCRWKGEADCHACKIADHLLDNGISGNIHFLQHFRSLFHGKCSQTD